MSSPTSSPTDADLLGLARSTAEHAYAPYSQFPVGAALLLSDGSVVPGCNVENASYGLAMCAERVAVGHAVAAGVLQGPGTRATQASCHDAAKPPDGPVRILAVAIVGLAASPCYPCGACRQVLHEFGCERVIVEGAGHSPVDAPSGGAEGSSRGNARNSSTAQDAVSMSFATLFPHAFGPESMGP